MNYKSYSRKYEVEFANITNWGIASSIRKSSTRIFEMKRSLSTRGYPLLYHGNEEFCSKAQRNSSAMNSLTHATHLANNLGAGAEKYPGVCKYFSYIIRTISASCFSFLFWHGENLRASSAPEISRRFSPVRRLFVLTFAVGNIGRAAILMDLAFHRIISRCYVKCAAQV